MPWSDRIGRRFKLRDLHILLAVVQSGSMGKAAGQLAMSQPVVSKAVSDMEHALGVRLLDRSRRGVELTTYGRAVIKRGAAVFDELRECVKEIEFLTDPTAGEINIGGNESFIAGPPPPFSTNFGAAFRESPFIRQTWLCQHNNTANCANERST